MISDQTSLHTAFVSTCFATTPTCRTFLDRIRRHNFSFHTFSLILFGCGVLGYPCYGFSAWMEEDEGNVACI